MRRSLYAASTGLAVLVLGFAAPPSATSGEDSAGARQEASEPGPEPGPRLRIRVVPPDAYCSVPRFLEARLDPPRPARFAWRAEGGELVADDRARVRWIAPATPGKARIAVEARLLGAPAGASPVRAERVLEVRRPSLDGLVRIPGGVYTIGDTWTDVDRPGFVLTNQNRADKPAHEVRLDPFWIARERVTNRQYRDFLQRCVELGLASVEEHAVMGPARRGGRVPWFRRSYADLEARKQVPPLRGVIRWDGEHFTVEPGKERHPVVDVTWEGASAYARFHGLRLPTNAEWEAAARGRDGRRYPWGDELPTPAHANVNAYHGDRLFPVGTFSPLGDSPYGVREMVGGVFEWVEDWYQETYYADHAGDAPIVDPEGPHWGKDRTIRGVPADQGVLGSTLDEQPPLSFRYAWFFEFDVGVGVATGSTGFRTAADDPGAARRPRAGRREAPRRAAEASSAAPEVGDGAVELRSGVSPRGSDGDTGDAVETRPAGGAAPSGPPSRP